MLQGLCRSSRPLSLQTPCLSPWNPHTTGPPSLRCPQSPSALQLRGEAAVPWGLGRFPRLQSPQTDPLDPCPFPCLPFLCLPCPLSLPLPPESLPPPPGPPGTPRRPVAAEPRGLHMLSADQSDTERCDALKFHRGPQPLCAKILETSVSAVASVVFQHRLRCVWLVPIVAASDTWF